MLATGLNDAVGVKIVPFQVYVDAPLALKLACDNEQTVAEAGTMARTGSVKVDKPIVFELTQPSDDVAKTV